MAISVDRTNKIPHHERVAFKPETNQLLIHISDIRPITPMSKFNLSKWARKHWINRNCFLCAMRVNINEIDTESKLASFIYEHFGMGTFNVFTFNYFLPSKRYNYDFSCTRNRCRHWKYCHNKYKVISGRYHVCLHNKKFIKNWQKTCRIYIKENPDVLAFEQYVYNIPKEQNRFGMKKFSWFWRGHGTRKIDREDYF